jgi:hypothetical protein
MYRQMDGYPSDHGVDLVKAFKGFKITNGISGDAKKTANGMGCFAAQLVAHFKSMPAKVEADSWRSRYDSGNRAIVGSFYLFAPETREVGEEFIYTLSLKPNARVKNAGPFAEGTGRLWLDLYEGEVAFFGMPGTAPEGMTFLYSGWLDDFEPSKVKGEYH